MVNESYMSGTGNDFICTEYDRDLSDIEIISIVSDALFPIDGVILVEGIDSSTVKMHYFNNDGTPAELCVNGVRCTAKFAVDNNLVDTKNLIVKAPVGDIKAFVENDYVKIEAPLPTTGDSIEIDSYICTTSEVGNPHLMVEVDDVEKFDLEKFSVNARKLDVFSNGINVEIFSVVERKFIYARVNERGVGETDACGSGALALFTYLREINKVDDDAIVLYPGGELELSYENEKLYLKGIDSSTVKMHYFNNDGTPAELCVNGVRCTAKFAVDNNLVDTKNLIVKAPVGDIKAFVENDYVKIEAPLPTTGDSIEIDSYICTTSEVGNPHLMVEVDDVEKFDLEKFSVNARKLDVFSNGINVEIFSVVERKFIYARVNERGVGETDACGSGALALFTYLREINKVDDDAIVLYPGGELELSYENEKLYLKGEVTYL